MTRANITKLGRLARGGLAARSIALCSPRRLQFPSAHSIPRGQTSRTPFCTSSRLAKPLSPEVMKAASPAELTDSEYHELADEYLDALLGKYEAMQDEKGDIDVEYSAGVMNVKFPSGEYVLNKQPPNKQIWLSSPLSGPKRYDYVVISEGQDQKQDTATGAWVYLRDGTTLNEVLFKETGVNMEGLSFDEAIR